MSIDKQCAPGKEFKDGSCFSLDDLLTLTKSYNSKHPSKMIDIKSNKKYLLKMLTKNMKEDYSCNDQVCWTQNLPKLHRGITNYTFRPSGPSNSTEWLSTTDIEKVMLQYERKYKDFIFLGANPSDFMDLKYTKPAKFGFKYMKERGLNRLGMVINLDKHNQPGSHWVGLFANLSKKQIYFFDSFAKQPQQNIYNYIDKLKKYMGEYDYKYNTVRHQFKNTECGVYSMNFVIRLLHGETFNQITKNITKDDKMNDCRNAYFLLK